MPAAIVLIRRDQMSCVKLVNAATFPPYANSSESVQILRRPNAKRADVWMLCSLVRGSYILYMSEILSVRGFPGLACQVSEKGRRIRSRYFEVAEDH